MIEPSKSSRLLNDWRVPCVYGVLFALYEMLRPALSLINDACASLIVVVFAVGLGLAVVYSMSYPEDSDEDLFACTIVWTSAAGITILALLGFAQLHEPMRLLHIALLVSFAQQIGAACFARRFLRASWWQIGPLALFYCVLGAGFLFALFRAEAISFWWSLLLPASLVPRWLIGRSILFFGKLQARNA